MTEKHPNDNVAARRRKLDDLFSDQPFLSATMRAHRLHERAADDPTLLHIPDIADEEDEEMLSRLADSRRERRLSSLWSGVDSDSILPGAALATTLDPDLGFALEEMGPPSTGGLPERVNVPTSGQVRLNLLLDLGASSASDRVRVRAAGADAEILTAKEAAAFLRVGEDTLRTWAQQRGLPCARIGRQLRFRRAALIEWLSQQEGK